MKAKYIVVLLVVVVGICIWFVSPFRDTAVPADRAFDGKRPPAHAVETKSSIQRSKRKVRTVKAAPSPAQEVAEPLTAEERREQEEAQREREEEAIVEDFDQLTDKWMVPAKGGVTMKDVDAFAALFRKGDPKDKARFNKLITPEVMAENNIAKTCGKPITYQYQG